MTGALNGAPLESDDDTNISPYIIIIINQLITDVDERRLLLSQCLYLSSEHNRI